MSKPLALPFFRATDAAGAILPGARLHSYTAGTIAPLPVYDSPKATTALPNPVVADSGGLFPPIYLDRRRTYRLQLRNNAGAAVPGCDFDPVIPDPTISVKDYGAVGDGVADDTAAVQAAIDAAIAVNGEVFLPTGVYSVTGLTAQLTAGPGDSNFLMRGTGRRGSSLKKRGNSSAPMLAISHPTAPAEAHVDIRDLEFLGSYENRVDGLTFTNIAIFSVTRVMFEGCARAFAGFGSLIGVLDQCGLDRSQVGAYFRANAGIRANAITLRDCRITGNTLIGLDFGSGFNLRVRDCDIEGNGTANNLATGGVVIRSDVTEEVGVAVIALEGCWFESNLGWSLRVEEPSLDLLLSISQTNFIASESGRALLISPVSDPSLLSTRCVLESVMIPGANDIAEINCSRLTVFSCLIAAITGTQRDRFIVNSTSAAGSAGNVMSEIHIGRALPFQQSWANGTGSYKFQPNTFTGDYELTCGGGSQVFRIDSHVNLAAGRAYRADGQQVVGARQPAIADDGAGGATAGKVNAILAALRTHGLIAS